MQSEHTKVLLNLLEPTEQKIKVMIINSIKHIFAIREVMPNADITVVTNGEDNVEKSSYEGLGIHWINEDFLKNSLPLEPDIFDVIVGENLFFRSCKPLRMVALLSTHLSETGYIVTSFANSLYWNVVAEAMKGNISRFVDTVFTDDYMSDILREAKFQDISYTPLIECTDEGNACIKQLISSGVDIAPDVLTVKIWFVKAMKFTPDVMEFKRRYSKKVRWKLVTRLLRIEHDIDVINNTIEVVHLIDEEKILISDIVVYIFSHISNVGLFINNFVPGFYHVGRVKLLRDLLEAMEAFYRDHAAHGIVLEWKKCIDKLDEYPNELLPAVHTNSLNVSVTSSVSSENRVAFITCVNDEEWYHETQLYIKNLNVPDGMAIELVPVRGAKSICQGYNLGMKQTAAKYKVYLHQDLLILNKDIIGDIVQFFKDKTIGAIGAVGAQRLSADGVWWSSASQQVGRVLHIMDPESVCKFKYPDFNDSCMDVEALDGILIATQVDIPWREDLFTGWHFYDISLCKEMQRHGYRVVVPKQNNFWCIHCSAPKLLDDAYEKYRQVFVEEYMENSI